MHSVTRRSRCLGLLDEGGDPLDVLRAGCRSSRPAAVVSVMIDWYVTLATRSVSWSIGMRSRSSSADVGIFISGLVAPGSGEYQRS